VTGETISLPVTLINASAQDWVSQHLYPINLSYRWCDERGNAVMADGARTPLPYKQLRAGAHVAVALCLLAPDVPGRYRLQALPLQESFQWFDLIGFAPLELTIDVVRPEAARSFPADDPRLYSHVGRLDGGARTSTGTEGFLLFGPYIPLPAGRWCAMLTGNFDPNGSAIRAEVVAKHGTQVFSQREVTSVLDSLSVPFELSAEVQDLEVRLWLPAQAIAYLLGLRLIPVVAEDVLLTPSPPVDANAVSDMALGQNASIPTSAARAALGKKRRNKK
jgi:hypothetical protein